MSKTPDKRQRTDLDLFILALIDGGVSTPYELQKEAGLSQGATIPALRRLLEARFVRQGKPGARGRTDYKVTASGKERLRDGWLPLIEAGPSGVLDSDLRVALLAIWASVVTAKPAIRGHFKTGHRDWPKT
jgi:DNA-binding PadR family transcriptional regulator